MKQLLLTLNLLLFIGCLDTRQSKTVKLYSDNMEESKLHGFFIDTLKLNPIGGCNLNLQLVSCWYEKAWKIENNLFNIQKTSLPFSNHFIKFNTPNITMKYKMGSSHEWKIASKIIEPDLGFYFQVEDKAKFDSIFINVITTMDSCKFYLEHVGEFLDE